MNRRTLSEAEHLYFIRVAKGRGPVKIGRARDPLIRLATLQVGSPYTLKLLGVLEKCGDQEWEFHRHLARDRMRGEWFSWTRRVEQIVTLALEGGDWRAAIAEPERPMDGDGWWVGSPLYAGNPNYPQFQVRANE